MGDFNIDLLKDDTDRRIHDYIDLIYSYSFIPTIYKPTRITETTATLIDNILTNCDGVQNSAIFVTDISDHMPTSLVSNLSLQDISVQKSMYSYKRCHSDDNISRLKKCLADVKWEEVLDNVDANQDYDTFINKFEELYNECIPLKNCKSKRKTDPKYPWVTKGLLKSINHKNKLYKDYIRCPNDTKRQKFKTYRNK